MTDYFVYKTFGLITPFMNGRGFVGNVKMKDEDSLSLCGRSMYDVQYRMNMVNKPNIAAFSRRTLINIVRAFYEEQDPTKVKLCLDCGIRKEEDTANPSSQEIAAAKKVFETKLTDRGSLEELLKAILAHELKAGKLEPADYPIQSLLHGIYINHNWLWLCEPDFWSIAECYGAQPHAPEDDEDKDEDSTEEAFDRAIRLILNTQNALVTELILHGYIDEFEAGTVDVLTPLLCDPFEISYHRSTEEDDLEDVPILPHVEPLPPKGESSDLPLPPKAPPKPEVSEPPIEPPKVEPLPKPKLALPPKMALPLPPPPSKG